MLVLATLDWNSISCHSYRVTGSPLGYTLNFSGELYRIRPPERHPHPKRLWFNSSGSIGTFTSSPGDPNVENTARSCGLVEGKGAALAVHSRCLIKNEKVNESLPSFLGNWILLFPQLLAAEDIEILSFYMSL